ncbi:unnamed protein product [Polarella glacialis]|uniref:Uncharacterized protein n=1 Tax=Polarella glacialis TaxID=89957 RepID=A0A813IG82_POLGL|nr:unnamed protein product [Polarella glacialis]|mmetsp:Transcript_8981/g.16554  ORF Transcript_8981/g.16554 Transcript_8981/m.16554 type:complete len:131 (-) Transcript_8981:59-451(-)
MLASQVVYSAGCCRSANSCSLAFVSAFRGCALVAAIDLRWHCDDNSISLGFGSVTAKRAPLGNGRFRTPLPPQCLQRCRYEVLTFLDAAAVVDTRFLAVFLLWSYRSSCWVADLILGPMLPFDVAVSRLI